jgi:hypothetical protein
MHSPENLEEASKRFLLRLLTVEFRDRSELDPGSWAEDKGLLIPYSTQDPTFKKDRSPWLIPAFDALGNSVYRVIDIRGPASGGKSLIGEIDIAYTIENNRGLYYYVWPSDEDGKDQMEDRVFPMIQANEFLAEKQPKDRHKKRNTKIMFSGMPFYSVGANESNAQRVRAFRLTMEEPHMFKKGMLAKFQKRTRGVAGSRQLTLSTGSVKGDQSDEQFNAGSRHEFQVPCPHCSTYQAMTMEHLEWSKDDSVYDSTGEYRWDALRESVRYECAHCSKPWPKDADSRLLQARNGKAVSQNPNAPSHHFSYHFNALVVDWISLEDIAEEYIKSRHDLRLGKTELYKDFVQKTMADAWDEAPPVDSKTIEERFGATPYIKRDEFQDEIIRFMTVDNQYGKSSRGEMPHRWCLIRAWGAVETRLIDFVKVDEWEDVEELRKQLRVPKLCVLVDIAFDRPEVLKQCYLHGWQGLIGEGTRESYPHRGKDEKGNDCIFQLPYSPPKRGHIGIGERGRQSSAQYFHWCHKPIKDLYHNLASGRAPDYDFSICKDVSEEYKQHVQVEYKKMVKGKWEWWKPPSKDDHALDCEQMNLSAAVMCPRLPLGKSLKVSTKTPLTPAEEYDRAISGA